MTPSLGETITIDFATHAPTTGAVTDADSTPTVEVFEDANDTPILTPAATKRTAKTGNYRVQVACTAGNGFEAGKSYNVVVSATVGGVTGKGVVERVQIRARSTDDVLPTASYSAPPSAAAIRAEMDANSSKLADVPGIKTKTDNLPADPASNAQVNTRLAAAGYVAPDNAGVAAIKAKTDNLPADPASNTQVNTRLAAAAYTAPDNAGIASVVATLASKLDVVLSTRLATGDYTSPLAVLTQTVKKYNVIEVLRILEAALAGKVTGATSGTPGTTVIRDANDTKNVISSVGDGVGNRSAVTVDPT